MATLNHDELRAAVIRASANNSTLAVFFHAAIAEQVGLGPTDEKTLFLLRGIGSLTAGEIAQHTGLTTASVTNLIDRLERKGFVQRVRDTSDRRRVIVQPNEVRLAELDQVFSRAVGTFDSVLDSYDDAQLATIADFLDRATAYSRNVIAALQQKRAESQSD
jgi:DNA-binding MarR family transcriptional regulator